jgi:hypothetical protein
MEIPVLAALAGDTGDEVRPSLTPSNSCTYRLQSMWIEASFSFLLNTMISFIVG